MESGTIKGVFTYVMTSFEGARPILGVITSVISLICFPDRTLLIALMAVLGAAFLDIVTKIMAISSKNGGYLSAVKLGKIYSKQLWRGTVTKIVSYLIISILVGLSYRVVFLEQVGILLGSFVYTVMFMREFQSNIENLIEAGADLHWLLLFSRKKNKDLMKPYEEEEQEEIQEQIEERRDNYEDFV